MSLTILVIITSIYSSTLNTLHNQDPVTEASSQKTCNWKWRVVPSPNGGAYNLLYGLTVLSPNDIWAVGTSSNPNESARTLVEHWDGQNWSVIPSPNAEMGSSFLADVSGISSNDIWAVGNWHTVSETHVLIEHWDGTSWSIVPASEDLGDTSLTGVTAISANDVWAVGNYGTGPNSPRHPFILHWDGTNWERFPVLEPNPPYGFLSDIVQVTPDDIWAVGGYSYQAAPAPFATLVIHYDGEQWGIVPSPNYDAGLHVNSLMGIAAHSSQEIWTVGYHLLPHPVISYELLERWNGSQWTIVPGALQEQSQLGLRDIAMSSASAGWAVGDYHSTALIEHWNGSHWQNASPNNGVAYLYAVAVADSDIVWAVGQLETDIDGNQTMIVQGRLVCGKSILCVNAPVLLSPAPNGSVTSNIARLDWKDQRCATHYQVQARSKSPQGDVVLYERKDRVSEYMFSPTTNNKRFVWRARACNAQGCGEWSEWRRFTIDSNVALLGKHYID